ncbi:MAG: hypothetical protein ABSB59_29070 [Streptosporangiaceae bacterium]
MLTQLLLVVLQQLLQLVLHVLVVLQAQLVVLVQLLLLLSLPRSSPIVAKSWISNVSVSSSASSASRCTKFIRPLLRRADRGCGQPLLLPGYKDSGRPAEASVHLMLTVTGDGGSGLTRAGQTDVRRLAEAGS